MPETDGVRPEAFYQLFDEFSKRNFSYRIPIRSRHTYLDALAVYLNLLADELENCIVNEPPRPAVTPPPGPARDLSHYILENLGEPLPTLRTLARMFHTNERKLKESFRELFETSIYQYYNRERLRKAEKLILQSNMPLKNISDECGFNTYHNFSTAFRKHFGYAPNMLRQRG